MCRGRDGSSLIAVHDGETRERKAWVAAIIDRLSSNMGFQLKEAGRWTGYDSVPTYRVRRRMRVVPDSLTLGCYDPVLATVERRAGHRGPWDVAAAREIAAIRSERPDEVILQIEILAKLVAVARSPRLIQSAVARWMGRMAVELTRSVSPARASAFICAMGIWAITPSSTTTRLRRGGGIDERHCRELAVYCIARVSALAESPPVMNLPQRTPRVTRDWAISVYLR